MMNQQLKMQDETILEPAGLKLRTLWDLVDRYRRAALKPPPHQREPSWPDGKKRDYIQRMTQRRDPPGSFETYQLIRDNTMYLNDGNNRLWTLLAYIKTPWEHGHTPEQAENYLRACDVGINHHHYKTHREAHIDFILVNFGIIPTPYEQLRGLLLYLGTEAEVEGYKIAWDTLHEGMNTRLARLISQFSSAKHTLHKQRRHDYALFFRYLTQDRVLNNYGTSNKAVTEADLTNGSILEMRMIEHIENKNISLDGLRSRIGKFLNLIEHELATIQEAWVLLYPELTMQPATLRWLVEASLWKKYREVPLEVWVDFLKIFIRKTEGLNRINYINAETGKPGVFGLTLSDLTQVSRLCRHLDFDKSRLSKPKKPERPKNIQAGFDSSHVVPGEPATFPEAAAINRARGPQPVDDYNPLGAPVGATND